MQGEEGGGIQAWIIGREDIGAIMWKTHDKYMEKQVLKACCNSNAKWNNNNNVKKSNNAKRTTTSMWRKVVLAWWETIMVKRSNKKHQFEAKREANDNTKKMVPKNEPIFCST